MRTRFTLAENAFLIFFGQSNITMTGTVDVHEHGAADKKGVFMDSGILALGHARRTENHLPQLLMKLFGFHAGFSFLISPL